MAAIRPHGNGVWEICRVYVHPDLHRTGLGGRLMDQAERAALAAGARELELWSDTRFLRAHRFYEKRGYACAESRRLFDLADTEEWRFSRPALAAGLAGIHDPRQV